MGGLVVLAAAIIAAATRGRLGLKRADSDADLTSAGDHLGLAPPPGNRPANNHRRAAAEIQAGNDWIGILVLSQCVADAYLPGLLDAPGPGGVGYLLKDRVGKVAEFVDSLDRVAKAP